jgi:hypothetical protein
VGVGCDRHSVCDRSRALGGARAASPCRAIPPTHTRCAASAPGVICALAWGAGRVLRAALSTTGPSARLARPPRLLFVGRTSPEKGLHMLLEAEERALAAGADGRPDRRRAHQLASTIEVTLDPEVVYERSHGGCAGGQSRSASRSEASSHGTMPERPGRWTSVSGVWGAEAMAARPPNRGVEVDEDGCTRRAGARSFAAVAWSGSRPTLGRRFRIRDRGPNRSGIDHLRRGDAAPRVDG